MKTGLAWRRVPREVLAQHLREVEILGAEAVGEASIYHCRSQRGESMAISLPGENGLIIDIKAPLTAPLERRRRTRGT
jgi:hypothetical protein